MYMSIYTYTAVNQVYTLYSLHSKNYLSVQVKKAFIISTVNFLVCQGLQGQCFQMSSCYVPADKTSDTEPPLHG